MATDYSVKVIVMSVKESQKPMIVLSFTSNSKSNVVVDKFFDITDIIKSFGGKLIGFGEKIEFAVGDVRVSILKYGLGKQPNAIEVTAPSSKADDAIKIFVKILSKIFGIDNK